MKLVRIEKTTVIIEAMPPVLERTSTKLKLVLVVVITLLSTVKSICQWVMFSLGMRSWDIKLTVE